MLIYYCDFASVEFVIKNYLFTFLLTYLHTRPPTDTTESTPPRYAIAGRVVIATTTSMSNVRVEVVDVLLGIVASLSE